MDWEIQRICTDVDGYELVVEKLKQKWDCDQALESWKWSVVRYGAVVKRGVSYEVEEAKSQALANVPNDNSDE